MNLTVEDLKKVLPNLRSKLDASSLGSVRIVSPKMPELVQDLQGKIDCN